MYLYFIFAGAGMAKKSDLFFMCACRATEETIKIQESEIADAKWMPVEEWLALDMYKSSLYQKLCEWGIRAIKGDYVGIKPEEMSQGSRPGTLLVYHTDNQQNGLLEKVVSTDNNKDFRNGDEQAVGKKRCIDDLFSNNAKL
jgi:hypothetical protein